MEKRKAWYVRCSGTTLIVTDGPFIETKEFVGGFALIRANSKEEAIEWARRHRTAAHPTLKKRRVLSDELERREDRCAREDTQIHPGLPIVNAPRGDEEQKTNDNGDDGECEPCPLH
jgi:YCII-related domain